MEILELKNTTEMNIVYNLNRWDTAEERIDKVVSISGS